MRLLKMEKSILPILTLLLSSNMLLAEIELTPITVTARKRNEPAFHVPLSLKTISADELHQRRITKIEDIAAQTVNLNVYTPGSRRTALFYVRGIGSAGPNPPATGIFLDDMYLPKTGLSALELFDLERIEVLRGPQSTLFGKNTEAGAIRLISTKPSDTWTGRLSAEGGGESHRRFQLSAGGPLSEKTRISFAAAHRSRDGFTKNRLTGNHIDDIKQTASRIDVERDLSDIWALQIRHLYSRDRDGGYALTSLEDVESNPFEVAHNRDGIHERDLHIVGLKTAGHLQHGTLHLISSFTDWKNRDVYDSDFTERDILALDDSDDMTAFAQEIRFESGADESPDWVTGLYFQYTDETDDNINMYGTDAALYGALPGYQRRQTEKIETVNGALFGQLDTTLSRDLIMTTGLRYDLEEKTRTSGQMPDHKETDHIWSPEIGLQMNISSNIMGYTRIARGWRSGGYNNPGSGIDETYAPETSWSAEIGVKAKSERIPAAVTLTAFWTRIDDLQLIQFNPQGAGFFFKNSGEAESLGGELQIDITPATWLRLDVAGGYTDATFRDAPDPALGVRYDGNRLPAVPQWTWHAGATIEVPLTQTAFITARTDISGKSDIVWDEANTVETEGYSIVNARVGIEHTTWGLHLFARNLFDRQAAEVVYAFPGSSPIAEPVDPRTAGVEFNLYF